MVELRIYDLLGREVKTLLNEALPPGDYVVTWDGRNDKGEEAASGVYLYRLRVGQGFVQSRKMVLVR